MIIYVDILYIITLKKEKKCFVVFTIVYEICIKSVWNINILFKAYKIVSYMLCLYEMGIIIAKVGIEIEFHQISFVIIYWRIFNEMGTRKIAL